MAKDKLTWVFTQPDNDKKLNNINTNPNTNIDTKKDDKHTNALIVKKSNDVNGNTSEYAVEMIDICKSFLNGKVIANDHINLRVKRNEVHAIIGENGAGKSTLMSILFGIYSPDFGTIKINGRNSYFNSAKDASDAGLGMVHQHFKLVSTYSVYENIILGSEDVGLFGILKNNKTKKKIESLVKKYHFNLDINAKISTLTVGQEQKTEILKLLYRNSDILIFDEPTAVLSPDEIEQFLEMIRQLKEEGKTIIIITHKFAEIKSVADRATVIRLGKYIADFDVKDKSIEEMANLMVGKKVSLIKNNSNNPIGKEVLDVKNLKLAKNLLPSSWLFLNKNPEVNKLRKLMIEDIGLLHNIKHEIDLEESTKKHEKLLVIMEELKVSFHKRHQAIIDNLEKELKKYKEINADKISALNLELTNCRNEKRRQEIEIEISKLIPRAIVKLEASIYKEKNLIFSFNKEFSSKIKNKAINFKIKEGEIFAIAGVEGNGQSELALSIAGMVKNKGALIKLNGKDISNLSINDRYLFVISHVPEDRHKYGLILDEQIYMNFALNRINQKPFSSHGFLMEHNIKENARHLIKKYDVRGTTRGTAPARLLSGGNQQKLIIAREITNNHKLIIMVQPTRGLDLGAIEYIHTKILEEKNKGNAVLLISYELDEILALADTIAVMYNGVFVGVGNKNEMTREKIGQLMAGQE